MKSKLSLVLLLVAVVLINHSAATDPVKSREKRSPEPQFGLIGALGKLVAKVTKPIVNAVRKKVPKIKEAAADNPGKTAAGGVATGGGIIYAGIPGAHDKDLDNKHCALHIRRDLPELQPVFIKDGTPHSLMIPTNGILTWAHGETSLIACPPAARTQNSISGTNSIVQYITCDNRTMFLMNGGIVDIRTVTCDYKVTGNVQLRPDPECAGTNKAIGFNVPFPTGDVFLDLFNSCFDETSASALYTHHVLFGNEIDHKCIYTSARPAFKSTGITANFFVSEVYTQTNQRARLADLFSVQLGNRIAVTDAAHYYDQSYLQRGHLTPDGDELFTTWQWSTYFFLNVAGMWDSINIGNWKNLETKVRTLASRSGENFEIYTGTYETLELCSPTVPLVCPAFTLVNGGIPVPKWLWKIVKAPTRDAAIALVVSNNPFESVDRICGTRQVDYGWSQNGFNNFQSGEVSYCTVQELRNVVGYIPRAALATNVLTFQ